MYWWSSWSDKVSMAVSSTRAKHLLCSSCRRKSDGRGGAQTGLFAARFVEFVADLGSEGELVMGHRQPGKKETGAHQLDKDGHQLGDVHQSRRVNLHAVLLLAPVPARHGLRLLLLLLLL